MTEPLPETPTVRLTRTAGGAYAVITTRAATLNVRLAEGVTAGTSLLAHAADLRQRAARLLREAALVETAHELI